MEVRFRVTVVRVLAALAVLAVCVIAGALTVAWTGLYNVAASRGHPQWLNEFLELGMRRSVETHAAAKPPPHINLDDPELIQLGAAHFRGACAPCHAAPGEPVNPIFAHMLPSPPRLEGRISEWRDQDLHWIVYHGLQYAGMPAWSGNGRQDEVWAIVAFLRELPTLEPEAFAALADRAAPPDHAVARVFENGVGSDGLTACVRCHDGGELDVASKLTPRLAGQSAEYLQGALLDYRADRRQSGIMEPIAAELTDEEIGQLARYLSDLPAMRTAPSDEDPEIVSAGRTIAMEGLPEQGVGACMSCHGGMAEASYPRLAGQPHGYLASQLRLFRDGTRAGTAQSDLMADIADGLGDEDIEAVSAFFAQQTGSLASASVDEAAP